VGVPRTREILKSPWQTLVNPSAITPFGQLHQSPPSPIPGDRKENHGGYITMRGKVIALYHNNFQPFQTSSTPGFSFVLVSHRQLQLFRAVLGPSLSSVSKLLRRRATDCIWETSVCGQLLKFWHVWNLLPQSIRLRLSVLVPYWGRLRKMKFILDVLR